jgi:hypothetical protein
MRKPAASTVSPWRRADVGEERLTGAQRADHADMIP